MAFNTVAAVFSRALRSGGNGTPALLRSPKVNRLSTSCSLSGGNEQQREVTKSSDSCPDRPGNDAPSSGEAANRCTPADKKRTKEPPGAPGVRGERRRSFTSAAPADTKSYMWARYNDTKRLVHGKLGTRTFFAAHPPHPVAVRAPCCCHQPFQWCFYSLRLTVVVTRPPRLSPLPSNYAGQMADNDAGTSRPDAFSDYFDPW